ncbi:hypothetical protein MUK42_07240 [Musa troglodytarum]|uniref:Uncharacterized protein n=1 Tax=Musa troglodytarum TaxID=320322 RepID=A0A9E7HBS2_9LILI|nr:hypothetical protein MUK42_07240 [Musa troglodytarum]
MPSDPLDNLRGKLRSLLGLPELANDISVSELTNDMSVSVNEVSAYDFVLEPRCTLANGDLFFACILGCDCQKLRRLSLQEFAILFNEVPDKRGKERGKEQLGVQMHLLNQARSDETLH